MLWPGAALGVIRRENLLPRPRPLAWIPENSRDVETNAFMPSTQDYKIRKLNGSDNARKLEMFILKNESVPLLRHSGGARLGLDKQPKKSIIEIKNVKLKFLLRLC